MTKFYNILRYIIVVLLTFTPFVGTYAQSVVDVIKQAETLIDEEKYDKAYSLLQKFSEKQVEEQGDSCIMLFNYEKGTCLFYMERYKEAIPYLQKGLQIMERLPHEDCNYLEMMYGIGSCYKKMGNLSKAEEYYRRTILKGNYYDLNCAIRNQTYSEMAELYTLMGKPELADICTSRIASEMRLRDSKDFEMQIDDLFDLEDAYEKQGKMEDAISTLRKILSIIDEKKGKTNEDYLAYSCLLGYRLKYGVNRPDEAASVFKDVIEIGKGLSAHRKEVCSAYEEYLRYLAEKGEIETINTILPTAVKYYTSTNLDTQSQRNLYEIVGVGLCDAQLYEDGIKFLEKKWKGSGANSIRALDYLGQFYFRSDPSKSLAFYKNAESQINKGFEVDDNTRKTLYEYLMYLNERLENFTEAIKYAELAEPYIKRMNDNNYYLRHLMSWSVESIHANDNDKANYLLDKAAPLLEGADNDVKIQALSNMGFVYLKTERLDKAIDILNNGIDLAIKLKGEKCPELATFYHNLGRAYMLKKDKAQALSALNKSKSLQLELEGNVMQRTIDYIKECQEK